MSTRKIRKFHDNSAKENYDTKSSKLIEKEYKRSPIFEFPPLPKWETFYYFAYTIVMAFIFFPSAYTYSQTYTWDESNGGYGVYELNELPYFGKRKKDVTDFEWRMWNPYIRRVIFWMLGHFVFFNIPNTKLTSEKIWHKFMLIYWLTSCVFLFGPTLVGVALAFGALLYTVMKTTRSKSAIWLISIFLIYFSMNLAFDTLPSSINEYMTMAFLSYKMLQYISYCMDEIHESRLENRKFSSGLYSMFWYAFYLPYSISLVVLYTDFVDQTARRTERPRNWLKAVGFAIRIVFWYFFIEFSLHFLYFQAVCTDETFLYSIPLNACLMMGYAACQFFHTKYVVIFGAPAVFARLDNMEPPEGPICIARVPLFARIWRQFDRGLYRFFKTYIFLPICRPTFSVWRKLAAVFLCYSFVLIWHGFERQYLVWIIMNIAELFLESFIKSLYLVPAVRRWREGKISDQWFRRLLAFLSICPLAIGIYANFYFVTDNGYVFVDRLFWGETVKLNWPFPFLLFGAYHLVNVCIDLDRWVEARKRPNDDVTKKVS